ncbi:MAG: kinase [Thermomicrobiales bacterium]|nr:kinase [Thermomicrobiales bacterium]
MKTIGLVAAQSKDEAATLAADVEGWLRVRGCTVVNEVDLVEDRLSEIDAIVVLGGDGLMMRAANAYPDIPLLGINFGKVGFLAMVERRDWKVALEALLAGSFVIEEGATLEGVIEREGLTLDQGWAINDVVIRSGVRMIDVEVYIDGHYVNTYPGDGMIVATPRGSTAYCMAAGGPILTAGVRGFAIVPISCHSPIRTPFVVAESNRIELLVASKHEAALILDGRPTADLKFNDVILVRRGAHSFRLISFSTTNFYDAFRSKFNFRIRPDAVPSRPPARRTSAENS